MSLTGADYFKATRHPWSSVLFVLPLLVGYEVCVVLLGENQGELLRNGADTWLRWLLGHTGLEQSFWPGILLSILLIVWSWLSRQNRPKDLPNVWMGMVFESMGFAVGLWLISLALAPCLDRLGFPLAVSTESDPAMHDLVAYLGAGIYEEALFRLLFFSLLCWLFLLGDIPRLGAILLAVLISSLIFAAAHHIGPAGEAFNGYTFLFRSIAGVYFAILFRLRGFGIAVGAHAAYDVLVGVLLVNR